MPPLDAAAHVRQLEQTIEELRRREQFLLALHGATDGLAEPRDIVQTLTKMLAQHLEVQRSSYASLDDGVALDVIGPRSNVPFVVDDVATDPRLTDGDRAACHARGIASAVTVPLHRGGVLAAVLAVHHTAPRAWTTVEVELVSIVVARCWDSLERAAVDRDRRDATHSLLESRARLEYAVRLSGLGFWYCDLPFSELRWDDRVKAHFWLPADTRVTIELFYERMHPDDREPTRAAIDASIVERSTYDVIYRTVDPATGSIRHIRAIGGTTYDELGGPIRFDGVTLDVSEIRESERRKDEFLAILAHELRNPLAPVRTGLELLEHQPEALPRIAKMMRRQLDHVVRIVDDLLDVSRVTLGKLVLVKSPVDIREALDTALDATRGLFDQNELRLSLDLPGEALVSIDAARIAQVFSNLFANAAKFSRRGGAVRVGMKVDEPFRVQVTVADEGAGIPRDRLESIFVMFTQLDLDPGRTRGGLGIGLSLAKRIVEMHGGRILAESPGEGLGASFTVELPLAQRAAVAAAETAAARVERAALRVLVVDDNVDAGEMLALLLETDGHRVERAYNGRDGLAAASAFAPDVILLDLGLPDMEGYEVARQIRASNAHPRPLIVAVTGWGDASHRQRTKEAGFDEHFVKPIDRDRLTRALAAVREA